MNTFNHLAGYAWLVNYFHIEGVVLNHQAEISSKHGNREKVYFASKNIVIEYFKPQFRPKETVFNQLEFALKYEDLNLALLVEIFSLINKNELCDAIEKHPSSKGSRRLGYLYEWATKETLEIQRPVGGTYIDLLDVKKYVTGKVKKNVKWRINDNLLGTSAYCPVVRRDQDMGEHLLKAYLTKLDQHFENKSLEDKRLIATYLYAKESKCSCAIEGLQEGNGHVDRLLSVLRQIVPLSLNDISNEYYLTTVHNQVVDKRYATSGFAKDDSNYVADITPEGTTIVHYIAPSKDLVPDLMKGLKESMGKSSNLDAVAKAALLSFSTYFYQLFESGTKRMQRFLVHQVLSSENIIPHGMVLPISSSILKNKYEYEQLLDERYQVIRQKAQYEVSSDQTITVTNQDALTPYYRYPDLTDAVMFMYHMVEQTIDRELEDGIKLVERFSTFKHAIKTIIDIPINRLDMLANQYYANQGVMQMGHRHQFREINDDEFAKISSAYQQHFGR